MSSAFDPRQPNRTRQPAPRPVSSGQRPMQPTQRAAQPAARSAQPSSCPTQPTQRPGQQPVRRPAQQSAAHTAQPAGGSRFKQQAPAQRTQGQAPQSRSHAHHAHGSHGVAPATRSSYYTRARHGASGDSIASILSENHIVENPKDYYAAVKKLNADMSLKPGTYSFTTLMDATEVVQQLMEGPNAGSDALTIPEGLTVDQIADRVAKAYDSISKEDFLNQAKASNYVKDYSFLEGAANDSLEGFLFPKTYSLGKKPSADDVIRAMLDQFNTEYKSLDFAGCEAKIKERYGVGMSDYDIINLASIVEREGLNAEQRAHVASVFYNRLAGKLDGLCYLNSDATMMYVTGGEVTADDLQSDSPYNTYKHEGLPPTPICSPSLEALKATLEPTDSDDLYFYITQDEEYFSQTYEEHQQSWN